MAKIESYEIENIYILAKQLYLKKINKRKVFIEIEKIGMAQSSAIYYIECFKHMYEGTVYKKTINNNATNYYLENIIKDFGEKRLLKALQAIKLHITYYEKTANVKQPGLRKILKKYSTISNNLNIIYPDEIKGENLLEGSKKQIIVNSYERNSKARKKCIEEYGYKCIICNFDFEKIYGEIGKEFIHVHHLKPLSEIDETYQVDPIKDLRPVCPNCHAMLHKRIPAYTIKEIKNLNIK